MKSQLVYLRHILECIARVEEYTAKGKKFFQSSHMAQDATLRQLQVMAESTQRLSDELKSGHPEVDWKALSGFRTVLVHDYLGIDLLRVFESVEGEMPKLKSAVEATLKRLEEEGDG